MKLYVPDPAEVVILLAPWQFRVAENYSNLKFLQSAGFDAHPRWGGRRFQVTLPAGTKLRFENIAVWRGLTRESHVRLRIRSKTGPKGLVVITLAEARKMEFELAPEREQVWWKGVEERLRAGEVVQVFPPGSRRKGIWIAPRNGKGWDAMPDQVVMKAGWKLEFVRRSHRSGINMKARTNASVIAYVASDLEVLSSVKEGKA